MYTKGMDRQPKTKCVHITRPIEESTQTVPDTIIIVIPLRCSLSTAPSVEVINNINCQARPLDWVQLAK